MKLVVWKKAAQARRPDELVSRDTSGGAATSCGSTGRACASLAPEDRLSRLAAWVLAAERAGIDYGLRLPGLEIAPERGETHRRRCLEALALWMSALGAALPWHEGLTAPRASPRWPGWQRLPREARDTLFLLAVIAWIVLPHLPHLPGWCIGAHRRGAALARPAGGGERRRCRAAGLVERAAGRRSA